MRFLGFLFLNSLFRFDIFFLLVIIHFQLGLSELLLLDLEFLFPFVHDLFGFFDHGGVNYTLEAIAYLNFELSVLDKFVQSLAHP